MFPVVVVDTQLTQEDCHALRCTTTQFRSIRGSPLVFPMWAMKEFYLALLSTLAGPKSNESKEGAAKRVVPLLVVDGVRWERVVLLNLRSDPGLQPMTSNVPSFSLSLDHLDRRTQSTELCVSVCPDCFYKILQGHFRRV